MNDGDIPDDTKLMLMTILPNGICVSKKLCDELRGQVEQSISSLEPGFTWRIQHLVDPTWWSALTSWERRLMGRCLAYWVMKGEVGLEFLGCWRCNAKRYTRTDNTNVKKPIKSPPHQVTGDIEDDPEPTDKS